MTLTEKLIEWYEKNGRDLPWRVKGGAHPRPYEVWLSEIMLQQTTVKTVIPYFQKFLKRFPDVETLAGAPLRDVLMLWQGLGYYARAKKLHECARTLVRDYGGQFPQNAEELKKLPGIGPYTSAAIASLGFNQPEAVVDGNVIRVLCRLKGRTAPVSELSDEIESLARALVSKKRAADYSSAIMDLGATVCTPRSPDCPKCPWREECLARKKNLTAVIPNISKPPKIEKKGFVFIIRDAQGRLLLRKRTEKGLLSGLTEFPWNTDETFPFENEWEKTNMTVSHAFTHFRLILTLVFGKTENADKIPDGFFVPRDRISEYPISTLMKKVLKKAETPQLL